MENKDLQNENDTIKNEENELRIKQIGFFKKVWYSITKIEKYPEMAAQGVGSIKLFNKTCSMYSVSTLYWNDISNT